MSTVSNQSTLLASIANLVDETTIADPTPRGGGSGGGRTARTPDELVALLKDPMSAPTVRQHKGSSDELSDVQIATVIVGRGSVGGAAFAISYQARNYPEVNAERLARLALDYKTNRNGNITGTVLDVFEACDELYEDDMQEQGVVEFCRELILREPALYSAAQKLETLGEPFGESISDQGSVEGDVDPEAPFLEADNDEVAEAEHGAFGNIGDELGEDDDDAL